MLGHVTWNDALTFGHDHHDLSEAELRTWLERSELGGFGNPAPSVRFDGSEPVALEGFALAPAINNLLATRKSPVRWYRIADEADVLYLRLDRTMRAALGLAEP